MAQQFPDDPLGMALFGELLDDLDDQPDGDGGPEPDDEEDDEEDVTGR